MIEGLLLINFFSLVPEGFIEATGGVVIMSSRKLQKYVRFSVRMSIDFFWLQKEIIKPKYIKRKN